MVLSPFTLMLLRRRSVLDHPNARSSHTDATPRGVGVALATSALAALALADVAGPYVRALAVGAGVFAVVGFADDLRRVPAAARSLAQLLIAAASLPWLLDGMSGSSTWKVVFGAGVVLWLVAFVNAFNFMDGINGISSAQAVVSGAAFAIIGHTLRLPALTTGGAILAAVAAGFAPLNYPTARGFLGDSGSYFLGGWIALLTVIALRLGIRAEAAIAPSVVYLADTAATLIRRMRRRERLWEAHKAHSYQRVVQLGWSHEFTTAFVTATSLVCSTLGTITIDAPGALRLGADAGIVVVAAGYLATPRFVARRVVRSRT